MIYSFLPKGTNFLKNKNKTKKKTNTPKKKSPDFSNLGFFMPGIVVTRLGVEPTD